MIRAGGGGVDQCEEFAFDELGEGGHDGVKSVSVVDSRTRLWTVEKVYNCARQICSVRSDRLLINRNVSMAQLMLGFQIGEGGHKAVVD